MYHSSLEALRVRAYCEERWCAVQWADLLCVSAHLPCGSGRLLADSPSNDGYRQIIDDIIKNINHWASEDREQHKFGFKRIIIGMDSNTNLIGNIDGTTGGFVLQDRPWDARASYLLKFLGGLG